MKIAVYTVITDGYDILIPPLHADQADNVDFIVFCDEPIREQWGYRYRPVPRVFPNPIDTSRYPKINSHLVLPEYDVTVYIDANLMIVHPDVSAFALAVLEDRPIAQFIHHQRDCTYSEARACIDRGLVDEKTVTEQIDRYRREGLPERFGVANNCIIFRRHHDPRVIRASEIWWEEFYRSVKRDQIASEYARWRAELPANHLPQLGHDNSFAIRLEHFGRRRSKLPSLGRRIINKGILMGRRYLREDLPALLRGQPVIRRERRYWASAFRQTIPSFRQKGIRLVYHIRMARYLTPTPRLVFIGCDRRTVMKEILGEYAGAKLTIIDASSERLAAVTELAAELDTAKPNLVRAVIGRSEGERKFYQYRNGTISAHYRHGQCERVSLGTVSAEDLLGRERIDLLRINLGGMETAVLESIRHRLGQVRHIHVEYHQLPGTAPRLSALLELLEEAGFESFVTTTENPNVTPFQLHTTVRGMSYQYWIAGRRSFRTDSQIVPA